MSFAANKASKYFGSSFILLVIWHSPHGFRRAVSRTGWMVSTTPVYFLDLGDSVADHSTMFVGVHKGCGEVTKPIKIAFAPLTAPRPMASFLYPPFNKRTHAVSLSRHHMDFGNSGCTASVATVSATPTNLHRAKRIYQLHRHGDNTDISAGAGIYDVDGLCPPFCAPDSNLFASTFGVEFTQDSHALVRPISPYDL